MRYSASSSVRVLTALLLALLAAGWGFYFFGLEAFLQAAYHGESLSYFNEFAADWRARQSNPTFQAFFEEAIPLLFRFALLGTIFLLLGMGLVAAYPTQIRGFFSASTSPYNLALLRIVTFGVLLAFDLGRAEWYAQFPSLLQVPPPGLGALLSHVPVHPDTVTAASILFRGACIFGLIGLYARTAAAIAVASGLYVLGVPQLYGKVIHYHHVLWFTGLLAASPCADVLSVDAIRKGWRTSSASPSPSRSYALPIRFLWLLLGIIYFFPGFWKLAGEGLTWALSDNLKYRMYTLWFASESFAPLFRLDQYPLLYQTAGLLTIGFETGFLFCVPFSSLRPIAAGMAVTFHQLTRAFLNIHFWSLPPFLPFLFDLRALFSTVGRWMHATPLRLSYDSNSQWERRVAAILQRFDLLDRLEVTSSPASEATLSITGTENALWVNNRPSLSALLCVTAYVPAAVPLLPLSWIAPLLAPPSSSPSRNPSLRFPALVGTLLLFANAACGLGHLNSWPFSTYPTFAVRSDSTTKTIHVEVVSKSDSSRLVLSGTGDHSALGISFARFRGLTKSILRTSSDSLQTAKLHALWTVWEQRLPSSFQADSVHFYQAKHLVAPHRSPSLLSKSLVTSLNTSPRGKSHSQTAAP